MLHTSLARPERPPLYTCVCVCVYAIIEIFCTPHLLGPRGRPCVVQLRRGGPSRDRPRASSRPVRGRVGLGSNPELALKVLCVPK